MRRSTTAMAAPLACLLTLVIAGHALATTTWSPPVPLESSDADAGSRALVTLGTGTVVVAYSSFFDPPGVWVRRSTDSGATWEAPVRLASSRYASAPRISGHGANVDVVWLVNAHVRYARSIDSGASFLPTVSLGDVPASGVYHYDTVRVGRGPNGRVAVAWEACTAGQSVRVRMSVDSGASFGAEHPLVADCGAYGHGVDVAVGTGVVYISYRDYVSAHHHPTRLQVVRSLDDGATWQAPVALADDTRVDDGTDITAEGADAYITYVNRHDGSARYSRTTDRGASWTDPAYLAPPTGRHTFAPVISLDGGVARAAYETLGSCLCDWRLFYRQSADGSSWTAPQQIATQSSVSGIGFADRIVVLYKRWACGPDECDGGILNVRTGTI